MDSNNPNPTTKRKPRRKPQQNMLQNPQQNMLQNPPIFPQNQQNYFPQPTYFPQNLSQDSSQSYHSNYGYYPQNPMPNFVTQNQPTPQNFQHFPNQPMSQCSGGYNLSNQSTPDGGGGDEYDEEDDDEQEFDPLSTQQNFTELLTQQTIDPIPNPRDSQPEKRIWTRSETTALISAFMNTSTDTIVGTQQKKGVFWGRVVQSYNAARDANPNEISFRTPSSLKGRWLRISEAVLKWCGSVGKATARKTSGQNDNDVIVEAHKIHQNSFGKFCFYDEWMLLKKWDKYRSILAQQAFKPNRGRPSKAPMMDESPGSGSSGKRTRDEGDGSTPNTPTSEGQGDEFVPRPEGIKKAKSRLKGKEPASSGLDSFGDRLQLYGEVQSNKLELERKKEARKLKQVQLDEFKMKWDILQQLMAKEVRAPWEEKMMSELQNYVAQFQG